MTKDVATANVIVPTANLEMLALCDKWFYENRISYKIVNGFESMHSALVVELAVPDAVMFKLRFNLQWQE